MNGDLSTAPAGAAVLPADITKISRGWLLALGILLILLGTAAVIAPFAFSFTIKIIIGWLLLIGGIFQIIHSFQAHRWKGILLHALAALLYLAAGIYLLAFPLRGLFTLTLFLAIFFMAEGFLKIIWSIQIRSQKQWGWLLFSGLISLLLGILIYQELPSSAAWAIGLLVGINLIFLGWSMVMMAVALKKAT